LLLEELNYLKLLINNKNLNTIKRVEQYWVDQVKVNKSPSLRSSVEFFEPARREMKR